MSREVLVIGPPGVTHTHTIIYLPVADFDQYAVIRALKAPRFWRKKEGKGARISVVTRLPSTRWVIPFYAERTPARLGSELWKLFWRERQDGFLGKPVSKFWALWPTQATRSDDTSVDSTGWLASIIFDEARKVPHGLDGIILMGSGQGCATALRTLIAWDLKIGAFCGLFGWLPPLIEGPGLKKSPKIYGKRSKIYGERWFKNRMFLAMRADPTEFESLLLALSDPRKTEKEILDREVLGECLCDVVADMERHYYTISGRHGYQKGGNKSGDFITDLAKFLVSVVSG